MMSPGDDGIQRFRGSLQHGFYAHIEAIAYPTGDAEHFRLTPHGFTEKHALHPAMNAQMFDHFPSLQPEPARAQLIEHTGEQPERVNACCLHRLNLGNLDETSSR